MTSKRCGTRLLAAGAGILTAIATAGPAAAQSNQPLHRDGWILAAAHAPGLQGSIWRTDLWVFGDVYGAMSVTLYFCRSGADNSAAASYTVEATGGPSVVYIEDVVDHFLAIGSGSWLGAIHYTANVDVQVWARVYSISPDGTKSYGQLIEGIRTIDASPSWRDDDNGHNRQRVYAAKHTSDGRFRVNFGIVNPTAASCDYTLKMYDGTGNNPSTGVASVPVTVPPYSMTQLSDPFAAVDGGAWHDHWTMLEVDTSGGGGFLYASVVDNATNDAFFVRGVKNLYAEDERGLNATLHTDGWLLAAARAPGLQGSIWRTDLWVFMQSVTATSSFKLAFCESGKDNSAVTWMDLPLTEGKFVYHVEDVVESFQHVGPDSWVGAIHYLASTGAQVWARVYSISPDGTASYGQLVEGVPTADMSMGFTDEGYPGTDEDQWLFAGLHTSTGRFRVNIGIINPTEAAVHVFVSMFTGDGSDTDSSFSLDVPADSLTQLTDPFASVNGGQWSEKQIRVEAQNGGVFGYISVVDNATNDAFFVRGIKRRTYGGS